MLGRLLDYLTARRMTIAGESMLPTLVPGDRAVFSVRAYRKADPARGDIVLLRQPSGEGRLDVKRVVGLPGETVVVAGGAVSINGERLQETYLNDLAEAPARTESSWSLGAHSYIILSDNRDARGVVDSRTYGVVKREAIVGKFLRTF
ncbi:MAG: signal peptidase I [SAR202 cluster bacterium]|nr:signal peptidase I [SAR202 cluster bacterium]